MKLKTNYIFLITCILILQSITHISFALSFNNILKKYPIKNIVDNTVKEVFSEVATDFKKITTGAALLKAKKILTTFLFRKKAWYRCSFKQKLIIYVILKIIDACIYSYWINSQIPQFIAKNLQEQHKAEFKEVFELSTANGNKFYIDPLPLDKAGVKDKWVVKSKYRSQFNALCGHFIAFLDVSDTLFDEIGYTSISLWFIKTINFIYSLSVSLKSVNWQIIYMFIGGVLASNFEKDASINCIFDFAFIVLAILSPIHNLLVSIIFSVKLTQSPENTKRIKELYDVVMIQAKPNKLRKAFIHLPFYKNI